jgi:hypothetical protein
MVFKEIADYHGIKLAIYDIDAVLEVNKRFRAIFEWKNTYSHPENADYIIPSFEYVGLKKLGKRLRVEPYIIVRHMDNPENPEGDTYAIIPINRFEIKDDRRYTKINNVHMTLFSNEEAEITDFKGLRKFISDLIVKGAGK